MAFCTGLRPGASTAASGTLSGETRVQGLNFDLVGTLPLTERFSALARVGAQQLPARVLVAGRAPRTRHRQLRPEQGRPSAGISQCRIDQWRL